MAYRLSHDLIQHPDYYERMLCKRCSKQRDGRLAWQITWYDADGKVLWENSPACVWHDDIRAGKSMLF